ncbi:MAG: FeoB-associated Cys-rich membrane protein [Eubacteriales bacterium]|nr:FeoB-associated Cys-rich membrane protein [Eubacteriales bacterium]
MATWIIGGVLVVIVGAVVWKMISDKRKGKHSCSCGCGCESCHGACTNSEK